MRYWNGKVDKYAITVYVKFINFLQINFTLNSNTLQRTVYQLLLVRSISLVLVYTQYSGHKPVDVQELEPSLVDSDEDKYKRKGTMERISRTLK